MTKDTSITIKEITVEKKYEGKYIAYDAAKSRKVIASGPNAAKLFIEVRKMDVKLPTIVFVPKHKEVSIY
jgi:hypothetical protein